MGRQTPISKIMLNNIQKCLSVYDTKNTHHRKQIKKSLLLALSFFLLLTPLANSSNNSSDCYYRTHIIKQQLIHTVTINPNKYKIINTTAHAINKNVAHVAQIAHKYNAIVAVNGGFFREINNNLFVPAGALKIKNTWHGIAYQPRASIGWQANGNLVLIDRLTTNTSVQINDTKLPVYYFNPHYNTNQSNNHKVILYSNIYPNFNNLNTLDEQNFEVQENGETTYIYNINNNSLISKFSLTELESAKVSINIIPQLEPDTLDLWKTVDFITSGSPVLIKNHNVFSDYSKEKIASHFINNPHPRTAICILENGFWKFAKTDSMTIPELANAMHILQCKDAINLDGGSSSDMYLSKELSNSQEFSSIVHPVTDAILVLPT